MYWESANMLSQFYMQNILIIKLKQSMHFFFFGAYNLQFPSFSFQTFMGSQQLKAFILVVIIIRDDSKCLFSM